MYKWVFMKVRMHALYTGMPFCFFFLNVELNGLA